MKANKDTTEYTFGDVPEQEATRGPWTLAPFDVSEQEASFHNLRCMGGGRRLFAIKPGRYMALSHSSRGVVMSNTPMEVMTNREAYWAAKGRVLISGLGLGMLLDGILRKPEVDFVRVIEIDQDVIDLVGPRFAGNPKLEIVHADAFQYRIPKGEQFDYAWHDIWDDICMDNLEQMNKLVRRYRAPATLSQGVWSRAWLRDMRARG